MQEMHHSTEQRGGATKLLCSLREHPSPTISVCPPIQKLPKVTVQELSWKPHHSTALIKSLTTGEQTQSAAHFPCPVALWVPHQESPH